MRFENKRGPKRKKEEKKMHFVSWKAFVFSSLFFHYFFSFGLQRRFLEPEGSSALVTL